MITCTLRSENAGKAYAGNRLLMFGSNLVSSLCIGQPIPHLKFKRLHLFLRQAERDGSNEYNNYQPAALNTTDQLLKDLDDIDIVFHIGDITYANGYIAQWDQFTEQIEGITSRVPYMIGRYTNSSYKHMSSGLSSLGTD